MGDSRGEDATDGGSQTLLAGVVKAPSTANNFVAEASIRGSDGAARARDKSGEQRASGNARTGLVSGERHFEQKSPMERNHWRKKEDARSVLAMFERISQIGPQFLNLLY